MDGYFRDAKVVALDRWASHSVVSLSSSELSPFIHLFDVDSLLSPKEDSFMSQERWKRVVMDRQRPFVSVACTQLCFPAIFPL